MKFAITVLALMFACSLTSLAGTTVVPTTTLAAETANNTSASSTWTNTSTGDAIPGNVSHVNIHTLVPGGPATKVYAHYIGWWGTGTGHINNGTDSATLAQAHATITDMMNRGIDGLIIDWYGAGNTHINQASLYIKQDAETRGGNFTFAIMEDQGAVRTCAYTAGCNATQAVINDLNYINTTYASSPAYMRINGRPVIFTFDTENLPNINWTTVLASIQGNPLIVLRNDQGFRISWTSGSYSWVAINTSNQNDWGQSYLDDFYATSRSYPSELVYAGVWKGFNDLLASWSANRIMSQNCGQVWLNTFNEMNKYFSSTQQPTAVQLVTWNDYEEATEIETGIDNCVSVSGSMSGSTLNWSIAGGQENTIDHYTVFISLDGQNLMSLGDVPAGTHQMSLSTFGLATGNYTLYVKAIGKPSILNKMSGAILYTQGNPLPVAALSVTPSSGIVPVSVTASTAGSAAPGGSIASTTIDFGDGTVVNTASATHTYATAGTYTVTATVTNNTGGTASATASVTAKPRVPPLASISVTPASGTAPVTVTASTAASTDSDGTITGSSIDFGDGTIMAGPTASHAYSKAGTFTVKGTVTDTNGLSAAASTSVSVAAPPVPFVITPVAPLNGQTVGQSVQFVATSTSGSPVSALRIYVDNISMYTVNATSINTTLKLAVGSHYVVLQGWNQAGQIAKTPMNITVKNQPPVATLAVTPTSGVGPLTVSATASGSDADGTIVATSINFGDGTVVNGTSAQHVYSSTGTFTVTATVTDNNGATATAQTSVTVSGAGVTLIRPSRGSVQTSPVAITATAAAATPIVAMRVYVDNVAKYSLNSFSSSVATLNTSLAMTIGSHYIVVQAWDTKGNVYKSPVTITVQ